MYHSNERSLLTLRMHSVLLYALFLLLSLLTGQAQAQELKRIEAPPAVARPSAVVEQDAAAKKQALLESERPDVGSAAAARLEDNLTEKERAMRDASKAVQSVDADEAMRPSQAVIAPQPDDISPQK